MLNYHLLPYMLYTAFVSTVSSTYLFHVDKEISLFHVNAFYTYKSVSSMYSLYILYIYISSLSVAHTELCIIYMPFTASFWSVYSTYRVNCAC